MAGGKLAVAWGYAVVVAGVWQCWFPDYACGGREGAHEAACDAAAEWLDWELRDEAVDVAVERLVV